MDLNSNLNESKKLKPIIKLKKYICDKIDKNIEINRFCRYLTLSPLDLTSEDYLSITKPQPDIKQTLMKDSRNIKDKNIVLIPYMFNDKQTNIENQVFIFVHNSKNNLSGVVGDNTIMVDITCPRIYNELGDYGAERIYEIATRIISLFDNVYVDESYMDFLGGYKFNVEGTGKEWRLGDSDIIAYTFPIVISSTNTRK